jgi:H+-transporting ATPase
MTESALRPDAQPSQDGLEPTEDLEKLAVGKVLTALAVQSDKGLSSAEAQRRLAKYGPNAIVEKEISLARKILGHFMGPIAYMIEAAAIVSAIIGHWDNFAIIIALLLFNAALEFWQDQSYRAAGDQRAVGEPVASARSIVNGASRMDYSEKFGVEPG